ncbi:hypothetical protein ACJX0J_032987, partial [Zea mays]
LIHAFLCMLWMNMQRDKNRNENLDKKNLGDFTLSPFGQNLWAFMMQFLMLGTLGQLEVFWDFYMNLIGSETSGISDSLTHAFIKGRFIQDNFMLVLEKLGFGPVILDLFGDASGSIQQLQIHDII